MATGWLLSLAGVATAVGPTTGLSPPFPAVPRIDVGRLNRSHVGGDAEFALLVADAWQGRGRGSRMLAALIGVARAEKITRISGTILPENHAMLHLCRDAGFQVHGGGDGGPANLQYHSRGYLPTVWDPSRRLARVR